MPAVFNIEHQITYYTAFIEYEESNPEKYFKK